MQNSEIEPQGYPKSYRVYDEGEINGLCAIFQVFL